MATKDLKSVLYYFKLLLSAFGEKESDFVNWENALQEWSKPFNMPMALFSTTDYLWCLYICKNQNEKRKKLILF